MFKKTVVFLLAFLIWVSVSNAQNDEKTSFREGISVTPLLGLTAFYGDAAPSENQGYAMGLLIDKEFLELLGVRLMIDKGNTNGIYMEGENRIFQGF